MQDRPYVSSIMTTVFTKDGDMVVIINDNNELDTIPQYFMGHRDDKNYTGEGGIDILNHEVFNYNGNEYLVVAGIEKDYINIYVATEKYKIGTLDCLDNQIDNTPQKREKFMNKKELEKVAIRFYLWDKYSINDEIRTFNVVEYDEGGCEI